MKITLGLVSAVGAAYAFSPLPTVTPKASTALNVAVDPTVVSKKDYEDICGTSFSEETLEQRLKRTSFLYPKHVEVIEDIAPIADKMVDEIVSTDVVARASCLHCDGFICLTLDASSPCFFSTFSSCKLVKSLGSRRTISLI